MNAVGAGLSALSQGWNATAAGALTASEVMAAAANGDIDLPQHLEQLARDGQLEGFLDQTASAIDLARNSPVFAEQLAPLLGELRTALSEMPTGNLPRVERDAVEATVAELDALLGVPDGPDGPVQVPGGGLQAHEDAGGHLIERHVGKSEQWLVDRVRNDNISAASSFIDLPEAERLVAETLLEHQDKVDAWVDGQGGNRLVIDATFDSSTGISVKRGESHAEDVFSVRLVLERSSKLDDIGFRIVTGYPTTP